MDRQYFSARLHGITADIVTAVRTLIVMYRTRVPWGCGGLNVRSDAICCTRTDVCVYWLSITIGKQGCSFHGFPEN